MKIAEAFVEAAATVCDSQSVYFGSSNINSLGLGGIWGLHRMVLAFGNRFPGAYELQGVW